MTLVPSRFLIAVVVVACFTAKSNSQVPERVYPSKFREANRLVALGKDQVYREEYQGALELFNQALLIQPDHIDAYLNRALVREQLNDPEGAFTDYQIVLLLDSTYLEAAFNRAKLRYQQQQYQRALTDFEKILTMDRGDTRMLYFKGTPLNQEGSVPLEGITTAYSMSADIHNYIGLCYHALGNFRASITAFNEAIALNSGDANYLVNRGLSQASMGNSTEAVTDFRSALLLDPEHAIAQFNLTQELESTGNLDMSAYDDIIERNPEFASAYVNRALAKLNAGDLRGALEDYNQAITLDPNDPLIYTNRALAKEKLDDSRGALADYNQALKLNPKAAIAYRSRGRVLFELKEFQLALEDLDDAIKLDPSHGGSYFNRALIYHQLGNLDQTCEDLKQAKQLGVKMADKALSSYCLEVN